MFNRVDGTHGDRDDAMPLIENDPSLDLIAEWTDEEPAKPGPTISSETIDHIAIDSLRFHLQGEDMEPLQREAFRICLRYYGVSV